MKTSYLLQFFRMHEAGRYCDLLKCSRSINALPWKCLKCTTALLAITTSHGAAVQMMPTATTQYISEWLLFWVYLNIETMMERGPGRAIAATWTAGRYQSHCKHWADEILRLWTIDAAFLTKIFTMKVKWNQSTVGMKDKEECHLRRDI